LRRGRLRPLAAPRFHTRKNEARLPRSEGAPEMGEGGETRLNRGIGSHLREGEGDVGGRMIKLRVKAARSTADEPNWCVLEEGMSKLGL
jgi:hypothetical protein